MKSKLTKLIAIAALLAVAGTALILNHTPAQAQDVTAIKTAVLYAYAGVPAAGTSEVQTITIQTSTSAGSFTLTLAGGRTTAAITWSATDATLVAAVDAALEALPAIGTGGVSVSDGLTSGIGTMAVTFTGKNARQDMPTLTVTNNLITGGTIPTIAQTTPGVEGTFRNAPTGTMLVDTVTPDLYINDSTTVGAPTWTKVSP